MMQRRSAWLLTALAILATSGSGPSANVHSEESPAAAVPRQRFVALLTSIPSTVHRQPGAQFRQGDLRAFGPPCGPPPASTPQ